MTTKTKKIWRTTSIYLSLFLGLCIVNTAALCYLISQFMSVEIPVVNLKGELSSLHFSLWDSWGLKDSFFTALGSKPNIPLDFWYIRGTIIVFIILGIILSFFYIKWVVTFLSDRKTRLLKNDNLELEKERILQDLESKAQNGRLSEKDKALIKKYRKV